MWGNITWKLIENVFKLVCLRWYANRKCNKLYELFSNLGRMFVYNIRFCRQQHIGPIEPLIE